MKLRQKSVKNLLGFLGDLKTPKFHSEINRPLGQTWNYIDLFVCLVWQTTFTCYNITKNLFVQFLLKNTGKLISKNVKSKNSQRKNAVIRKSMKGLNLNLMMRILIFVYICAQSGWSFPQVGFENQKCSDFLGHR